MATFFYKKNAYNLFTSSQALVSRPKTVRHEEKKIEAVATIEEKLRTKHSKLECLMFPTEIAQTAIQLNFAWEGWERVSSIFPF